MLIKLTNLALIATMITSACATDRTNSERAVLSEVVVVVDSQIYVTGNVSNDNGTPLNGAEVSIGYSEESLELNIGKVETDDNGCFVIDRLDLAYDPLFIKITKPGYKTIQESKPFAGYYVKGHLSNLNTPSLSKLVWTEIDLSLPNLPTECE